MKNLLKINLKPTCLFLYRHKYKPIPSTLYICKPRNSLRVFGDRLSGKYSFLIFSPCNEIVGVKRMVLGKKKKKREKKKKKVVFSKMGLASLRTFLLGYVFLF